MNQTAEKVQEITDAEHARLSAQYGKGEAERIITLGMISLAQVEAAKLMELAVLLGPETTTKHLLIRQVLDLTFSVIKDSCTTPKEKLYEAVKAHMQGTIRSLDRIS